METNASNDREKFDIQIASKKVIKLKSFYIHTIVYIIGLVAYVLKNYYGFPLHFFPFNFLTGYILIIWTCVYVISALEILVSFKIFGKEWEERKLKNILDKKQKKQKWE
ncbi:2TM domain-containing protein [Flavobacterium sp. N1736]|uniref:2TM domain-containing protein n=1 Tax=Flavobacterium sp. N1736 TaxID=2986823 RepID=UPI002225904D|nr:2TM domain-containing protein [Flavobacterium sp. N1736]